MLALAATLLMQPTTQPAADKAKDAPLHPLVTEVFYAVPRDADPDQDGKRSATSDEFIEIVNPHAKPINLKGYRIADARKSPPTDSKDKNKAKDKPGDQDNRFSFTFPDLTLQPGEVVVLFNGYQSSPAQPCGTKDSAPTKNPKFHDAYVFSAETRSQYVAFSNSADCIALYDADGQPVECLYWGEKQQPEAAPRQSKLPEARSSVQRSSPTGDFVPHTELPGNDTCSPGKFSLKASTESTKQAPPTAAPPSSSSPASTPTRQK